MSCFSIQITNANDFMDWVSLPVSLDCDSETNPAIDLSENDLFKDVYVDDIVYNLTVPATEKNYRILGSLLSGANFENKRRAIRCLATYNGEIMVHDSFYVVKNSAYSEDKRIELQLFHSKSWARLASEKLLKDVKLIEAPILHIRGYIDSINSSGAQYEDDGNPIRFPIMRNKDMIFDYVQGVGGNYQEKYLTESDFEPWIYALPMLKKGFKEIGWNFKCQFLESQLGRRILTYVISEDYNNIFNVVPLAVRGSVNWLIWKDALPPYYLNEWFYSKVFLKKKPYDTDPQPVQNEYWVNGEYREHVICDVSISMVIKSAKRSNENRLGYIGDIRVRVMAGDEVLYEFDDFLTDTIRDSYVNISLREIEVSAQNPLKVLVGYKIKPSNDSNNESFLKVYDQELIVTKVHKRKLAYGDSYLLGDILQPKDTLLDYLKGIAHLFFGKVVADYSKREIEVFTPFDAWGNFGTSSYNFVGYYTDEIRKLDKIVKNSFEISQEDKDYSRYLKISFQESNEDFVKDLYPTTGKEIDRFSLYGLFVDYGEEYNVNVQQMQNPYFTVTHNSERWLYPIISGSGLGYSNVGRRVLFAYGNKTVKRTKIEANGVEIFPEMEIKFRFWNKFNDYKNPFWAWQSIDESIFILPDDFYFHLAFKPYTKDRNYKPKLGNLYDAFIEKYARSVMLSQKGILSKYVTPLEFLNWTNRAQYMIEYRDIAVAARIVGFRGYKPCQKVETTIEFVVDNINKIKTTVIDVPVNNLTPFGEDDFYITIEKVDCAYYVGYIMEGSDITDI